MKDTVLYEILDLAGPPRGKWRLVDVDDAVHVGTGRLWTRMALIAAVTVAAVALIIGAVLLTRPSPDTDLVAAATTSAATTPTSTPTNTSGVTTPPTSSPVSPPTPTLDGLRLTPANVKLVVRGEPIQLAAVGKYSDGSERPLDDPVEWSTEDPHVATVDTLGVVTAVGSGQTTIRATSGGQTGSAEVTTTESHELTSITVSAITAQDCANGFHLAATGAYADGQSEDLTDKVAWTSSNPNFSAEGGFVQMAQNFQRTAAQTTITAALDSVVGQFPVSCAPPVVDTSTTTPVETSTASTTVSQTPTATSTSPSPAAPAALAPTVAPVTPPGTIAPGLLAPTQAPSISAPTSPVVP